MLLAKNKPIATACAFEHALLEEGAKRGNTGAWAAHDNIGGRIFRQAKRARLLHIDRNRLLKQRRMVGKKTGGQAAFRASMGCVPHDGDTELNFTRMRLQ